jgi:hypothetical protein
MSTLIQRSFSGGEIAPSLYARVDTAKYASGLRICRNMQVMRHGGAQNRPGTEFICEVSDSSAVTRLIPFIFNADQTYILEFGNLYMRVIKDGVPQREAAKTITGITQANPGVVTTSGAHSYSNGDEVYLADIVGMTELNKRNFKVANVTATTYELQDMDSANFDTSALTAYASAGTSAKIYEIATPYVTADLDEIQFVQSADVITLVHPTYAPRELSRSGDQSWTLATIVFNPVITIPTGITYSGGGSASLFTRYVVTAIDLDTGEESFVGSGRTATITAITQANPGVITATGHAMSTGDIIDISDVVGMTELNGNRYRLVYVSSNTFSLTDLSGNAIDTTGFTAYSSAGTVTELGTTVVSHAAITSANPINLSWTAVSGADEYNVYKEVNSPSSGASSSGIYGFLGIAKEPNFSDIGSDADGADNPTEETTLFAAADDYPSAVTYVQQRRGFANSNNDPERVWLSRIGNFKNFTRRSPTQADDSFNFLLAGRQVNSVKHLIDIGELIVFTAGGEWGIQGDAAGTLTPSEVNPKQYGYAGSTSLPPIVVGGNVLFVQARGSIVRDLSFQEAVRGYRGTDLTIFSSHLFDEYTLDDWAFQQIPQSIIWAVRSDGTLLGLTYIREHEMFAWHRHDFQSGTVEKVASVPEGNEDSLYVIVKRTINGRTTRYIEKFSSRQVTTAAIEDSKFMDSSESRDGTHGGSTTMILSGGTTWEFDETLTLTASVAYFTSGMVGDEIHMTGSGGTLIRFTIDAYSSTTVVTGRPNKTVPAAMQGLAASSWGLATSTVSGLWHLEGESVSVFGDGFVEASPNNASYDTVTVADGVAVLSEAYVKAHVGLPYISDIETLDIDTPQGETLVDKKKRVNKVSIFVEESRGIWAGNNTVTTADPLAGLVELKVRDDEDYDSPVDLQTGVVEVGIQPQWNSNGRVFIRQVDPVPLAVLAIAPAGLFPLRGG